MKRSQSLIQRELTNVKDLLMDFPRGASIEDIRVQVIPQMELRTLQRRLFTLQQQGYIRTSGKGRGTLYHIVIDEIFEVREDESSYNAFPLSAAARKVLDAVSQPFRVRKPVGYNRSFLDSYQPNKTFYLNENERGKLSENARTGRHSKPAGSYAREVLNRLLIDLSFNSARLEGNTYTLLDTERLIAFGQAADNRSEVEAQMIINHKEAIEFMVNASDDIRFDRYSIFNLHALLADNLLPEPAACGRLRTHAIGIMRSVYTPLAVPQLVEELFDIMLEKAEAINDPFEQAFFIMVHLPYLQPFDDVNKRVSRLACNIPLNRHNLAPMSFTDVPERLYIQGLLGVYELNAIDLLKDVFMKGYEHSCYRYAAIRQELGDPDLFKMKYRDAMRSLITQIILNNNAHKEAIAAIEKVARLLPAKDQRRFTESVGKELGALHEGNFARYHVSLKEFRAWSNIWKVS